MKIIKFCTPFLAFSLLTACQQSDTDGIKEEKKDNIKVEKTEKVEKHNNKTVKLKETDLKGKFNFKSANRNSIVKFDDTIIRFSDGKGNLRYRIANEGKRITISDSHNENTKIYKIKKVKDGFNLIELSKKGKATGESIDLIKKEK